MQTWKPGAPAGPCSPFSPAPPCKGDEERAPALKAAHRQPQGNKVPYIYLNNNSVYIQTYT